MQQRLGSESSIIRVAIIANSVVMRAGLEALITTNPDLEVVGSYANLKAVVQQIEQLQPDVVLLELNDLGNNSLFPLLNSHLNSNSERGELIYPVDMLDSSDRESSGLSKIMPETFSIPASPAVVVLVNDWQSTPVAEALRTGVKGVLPGDATIIEIVEALQAAAIGLTVLHPDIVSELLSNLPTTTPILPAESNQTLTAREVEVLSMLAEGLGNKAIARRLTISEHTVKFHIGSIFSKLNASSRTEAVILGARQGLILL